MLSMLVGMKDSIIKYLINDLAACQDKKKINYQPSVNCILWPGSQKFPATPIAAFFRIFTPVPQTWPNKCSCGLGLVQCIIPIHLMHIKGIKALRFWNKKSLDDIKQPAFVKMSRTIPFRTITKRQFPTIVLLFITSSSSFSTSLLTSCTDVTGEQLWNNKNVDGHLRSWLRSRVSVRKGEWIAN